MRARFTATFILLTAILALAALPQTPPPATSFPIPSTFTAILPCADCPSIHESLTFLPRGIALDRLVYQGRNVSSQSLARWAISSDATHLYIRSSGAAGQYSIIDSGHIRKLSPPESKIPDEYLPAFTRADSAALPSEPLSIRGDYSFRESGSSILECDSGLVIPISQSGDNAALIRAFKAANLKSMGSLMVKLTGRVILEKDNSGSEPVARFQVTRFDQSWSSHCGYPGIPAW